MATVMAHPVAMRATAAQRPSRGASSTASSSRSGPRDRRGSASAVMMHLDGCGQSHVHGKRGRVIEPNPDRESLRNHYPVEVAANDGKTGAALIGRLYARAQAFHPPRKGAIALGHGPHRRSIADGDSRQFGLPKVGDGIPRIGLDETEQRVARYG